jgi:hypothetical protein
MSSARPEVTTPSTSDHPDHPAGLSPRLTQRLRRRVAALSLVGAMMVALPLVQVLRFQTEQIDLLIKHQSALNPVARAVQVQRGVMAHRDLAHQVLQGLDAAEPDRLRQQQAVSQTSTSLSRELHDAHYMAAHQEALALQQDFALLAPKIAGHQISALDSDQSHRLLVEQVLQVMDLVQDAQAERTAALDLDLALALAPTRQMPRQIWLTSQKLSQGYATQTALAQRWQAIDKAQATATSALAKALVDAQRQRTRTLAMVAALATLALGLVMQLWRGVVALPQRNRQDSAGINDFRHSQAASAPSSVAAESRNLLGAMRRDRRAQDKAAHAAMAPVAAAPAAAPAAVEAAAAVAAAVAAPAEPKPSGLDPRQRD